LLKWQKNFERKVMNDLTPKAQGEKLLATMQNGKEVLAYFDEKLKKDLLIAGHPMQHWKDEFHVHVQPDNMTPSLCKETDMKILQFNQEVAFFHNVAFARREMIKHGNEAVYMKRFQELVREYKESQKKLPAAATLETLARADQLDVESAQAIAEIEVVFWKNMLNSLGRSQRLVNDAAMMIAAELKNFNFQNLHDSNERNSQ